MSEIILEFAEPTLVLAENFEEQKSALSLAMIAWNMSLMDDYTSQMESLIKNGKRVLDKHFASDISSIIQFLVQRKLTFYADIRRTVLDYDIVNTDEGLQLNVVSTLLGGNNESPDLLSELEQLATTE
jgi:fatty acid-binding protein DegV